MIQVGGEWQFQAGFLKQHNVLDLFSTPDVWNTDMMAQAWTAIVGHDTKIKCLGRLRSQSEVA